VLHGIDHFFWHANVALSDNGTLAYLPAERVREAELVWLDRQGNATPVPGGRGSLVTAALSPDGREIAVEVLEGTASQVWILDLERGTRRLLVPGGDSLSPIWSSDGAFIAYVANREGNQALYRTRADGTGTEEYLVRIHSLYPTLTDWSRDGRSLLFSAFTDRGDEDIWIYSGGKVTPLIASPFSESSARFSPDGRFIAFAADEGGVSHVYVQPFPGPGRVCQVVEKFSASSSGIVM
jgi:Tol biopolymer transport system component